MPRFGEQVLDKILSAAAEKVVSISLILAAWLGWGAIENGSLKLPYYHSGWEIMHKWLWAGFFIFILASFLGSKKLGCIFNFSLAMFLFLAWGFLFENESFREESHLRIGWAVFHLGIVFAVASTPKPIGALYRRVFVN